MNKSLLTFLLLILSCIGLSAEPITWNWNGSNPFNVALSGYNLPKSGSYTIFNKNWDFSIVTEGTNQKAYINTDASKGLQFGAKAGNPSELKFVSNDFSGKITSVKVNTSTAANGNPVLSVTVNGVAYKTAGKTTYNVSTTATEVEFTPDVAQEGEIVILWSQPSPGTSKSKAIYTKGFSITYDESATPVTGPAKPTFEPVAGTYTGTQNVTIACATEGATLEYSFDGTTWNAYPEAGVEVASSCTLYAKATDSEGETSEASADYTIIEPITSFTKLIETVGIPSKGNDSEKVTVEFNAVVLYCNGKYAYISDGEKTVLLYTYDSAGFNYTKGDVIAKGWEVRITNYNELIEFIPTTAPSTTAEVSMELPSANEITPEQITNENQALYVKLTDVVFSSATASTNAAFTGTVNGETVNFFNRFVLESVPAGTYDVYGFVARNNNTLQIYPIEYLDNKVATPAISFDAATNTVTIACATEGASVEYSLDGENWQPYTEPFVIEKDCTVSARATMADMNDSSVATLDCKWTDLNAVAAPKFSLEEGEYLYGTELTITAAEGYFITGEINNVEFDTAYNEGDTNIFVYHLVSEKDNDSIVFSAMAYDEDGNMSDVAEAIYTVRFPKAATASIANGEVVEGKSVSFTWEEVPGFTYTVTDENKAVLATGNADEAYTFNTLGTVLVTLSGKVYDKTFTQDFIYEVVEKPAAEYYVLVTDASQLQNGDQIVVAAVMDGQYYAMSNEVSGGESNPRIQGTTISVTDNYITLDPEQTEVAIFTLKEGNTAGAFALEGTNGYVISTKDKNGKTKTNTTFSNDGTFKKVTFYEDGSVKFYTCDDRTLWFFHNDTYTDFRGYLTTNPTYNDATHVYFYKKSLGKKAGEVTVEFAGEKECGYLEDKVKFNLKGVDEGASVSAVITDTEGNEVAAKDIEADANEVSFTAPAAHTYTVTISVGAGFNYRPTTATSAPVHVLPMVQLISQADHYVWEAGGTIGVHAEGTNYTIRNYEHGTLEFYYKHDKNETLRANAAEAEDSFKKYAGEELLIKPGHTLTYYFGNEAGEKVGERSFNAAIPTGVEGIEVSTDADAEYYTLQGVRVSASNLTPGLYIRRQGNTATKVMVK